MYEITIIHYNWNFHSNNTRNFNLFQQQQQNNLFTTLRNIFITCKQNFISEKHFSFILIFPPKDISCFTWGYIWAILVKSFLSYITMGQTIETDCVVKLHKSCNRYKNTCVVTNTFKHNLPLFLIKRLSESYRNLQELDPWACCPPTMRTMLKEKRNSPKIIVLDVHSLVDWNFKFVS